MAYIVGVDILGEGIPRLLQRGMQLLRQHKLQGYRWVLAGPQRAAQRDATDIFATEEIITSAHQRDCGGERCVCVWGGIGANPVGPNARH